MTGGLVDSFSSEPLLGADELAALLHAPGRDARARRRWVYRAVEAGMPALRIGSRVYFRRSAVEAWLNSHRVGEWAA